jgi:hypothetical protein
MPAVTPTEDQLPAVPEGAMVTAWNAGATGPLSPRAATLLMLHVSWQRWQYYAALLKEEVDKRGAAGLTGFKRSASNVTDGIYPTSEEIRALTRLEAQERDRCARLAREAHEMGLLGDEW